MVLRHLLHMKYSLLATVLVQPGLGVGNSHMWNWSAKVILPNSHTWAQADIISGPILCIGKLVYPLSTFDDNT